MAQVLLQQFLLSPALVIVSHLALLLSIAAVSAASSPPPHCPSKCGSIEIPYPFGIGAECAWPGGGNFTVACNHSFSPPRPYTNENVEATSISVETGEMHVYMIVADVCYNSSNTIVDTNQGRIQLSLNSPFLVSPTENVFTAIGCDTLAFLAGGSNYFTGCISYCASLEDSAGDGDPCTGLGCCQTSIPANLSTIKIGWNTDNNTQANNSAWNYNPCSYAFVANKHWYNFSRRDLKARGKHRFSKRVGDRSVPLVLDWAIRGNGSCEMVVPGQLTAPACASANSYCQGLNATRGGGYLCKCSQGYMGNPYIVNGCTNIDECELRKSNPAKYGKLYPCGDYSKCQDTPGDYKCKCKFGHRGYGKSEKGCQPIFSANATAIVVTFVAVVLAFLVFVLLQKRQRSKRFNKNGGEILKKMDIRNFDEKEIKKITNNYKSNIGKGYFGQVYKGTIDGSQQVAVKCSIKRDQNMPKEEFVNEITIQFRIRHTNLVRLIGCCLEAEVPKLVFEYIPNGSLNDMLHGTENEKLRPLSLMERLDIAIGSAQALAYMHSHGEDSHIHGDIKPGNILLDNNLVPKVSDFGSSKLLLKSSNAYVKDVKADWSYIDPVYVKTKRFLAKSDVYSFGVVLLELITRKTAKYNENQSLPMDFVKCCKEDGNGRRIYDKEIFLGDAYSPVGMDCIDRIGVLAVRCLKEDIDERPTMVEVVEELELVKLIASGRP